MSPKPRLWACRLRYAGAIGCLCSFIGCAGSTNITHDPSAGFEDIAGRCFALRTGAMLAPGDRVSIFPGRAGPDAISPIGLGGDTFDSWMAQPEIVAGHSWTLIPPGVRIEVDELYFNPWNSSSADFIYGTVVDGQFRGHSIYISEAFFLNDAYKNGNIGHATYWRADPKFLVPCNDAPASSSSPK